jgi:ABC-2 type transport system ATP-binding protein
VLGLAPAADPAVLRQVGYLPEERGLYKNMTAVDVIVFGRELRGGRGLALIPREARLRQRRRAEDRIERSADLVTHAREKRAESPPTDGFHSPDQLVVTRDPSP